MERHWSVDQPIGLYRRGRVRDFASRRTRRGLRRRAGRRTRDQADRAGRARFVAAGGGAAALRPRSRRGDDAGHGRSRLRGRSEEHTSELQSLMRISYAVFCLKKKKKTNTTINNI